MKNKYRQVKEGVRPEAYHENRKCTIKEGEPEQLNHKEMSKRSGVYIRGKKSLKTAIIDEMDHYSIMLQKQLEKSIW